MKAGKRSVCSGRSDPLRTLRDRQDGNRLRAEPGRMCRRRERAHTMRVAAGQLQGGRTRPVRRRTGDVRPGAMSGVVRVVVPVVMRVLRFSGRRDRGILGAKGDGRAGSADRHHEADRNQRPQCNKARRSPC